MENKKAVYETPSLVCIAMEASVVATSITQDENETPFMPFN